MMVIKICCSVGRLTSLSLLPLICRVLLGHQPPPGAEAHVTELRQVWPRVLGCARSSHPLGDAVYALWAVPRAWSCTELLWPYQKLLNSWANRRNNNLKRKTCSMGKAEGIRDPCSASWSVLRLPENLLRNWQLQSRQDEAEWGWRGSLPSPQTPLLPQLSKWTGTGGLWRESLGFNLNFFV